MHEVKRRFVEHGQAGVDAEAGRECSRAHAEPAVVVPEHEHHVGRDPGSCGAKLVDHGIGAPASGMHEVAEHDHAAGGMLGCERGQPVEITLRRALGHGDACAAERRRLAEVDVGHEQRAGGGYEPSRD